MIKLFCFRTHVYSNEDNHDNFFQVVIQNNPTSVSIIFFLKAISVISDYYLFTKAKKNKK